MTRLEFLQKQMGKLETLEGTVPLAQAVITIAMVLAAIVQLMISTEKAK